MSTMPGCGQGAKPVPFDELSRTDALTRRRALQRLFSTFPTGRPGIGLLLLRLAVATALVVEGTSRLTGPTPIPASAVGFALVSFADAGALAAGFLAPLAGLLAAAISVGDLVLGPGPRTGTWLESAPVDVLLFVMATAIALLGPGGFSADARLFGRREIVVPRPSARAPADAEKSSAGGF